MEAMLSLKTTIVIFISGMLVSLIVGNFLSLLAITTFIASEFNLLNLFYTQIPEEIRDKYRSKLLVLLEYITEILKQAEGVKYKSETLTKYNISKKRIVKDE